MKKSINIEKRLKNTKIQANRLFVVLNKESENNFGASEFSV